MAPLAASDGLVLARLTDGESAEPGNTVVVRWADLAEVELRAQSVDGRRTAMRSGEGGRLFDGMRAGPVLRGLYERVAPAPASQVVPLFFLRNGKAGVHVYSQIRFLAEDACFIRLTERPLTAGAVEELGWVAEAVRLHAGHATFLNNHQCYYRKCFAGQELEYKYTLDPSADVWGTAVALYERLRADGLDGYVVEYRDEFQAWDYVNHLFEIPAPDAERGYVSFIPAADGSYLVKRKWYEQDALARREQITKGVRVAGSLDRYVAEELRLQGRRLPSFRRVRYDVNFESLATGHVYGVFVDRCWLLDRPEVVLSQCELEYLRSRTVLPPDEAAVLVELDQIASWLEGFLRAQSLAAERGFYSKMSFLRDTVASQPELAVASPG